MQFSCVHEGSAVLMHNRTTEKIRQLWANPSFCMCEKLVSSHQLSRRSFTFFRERLLQLKRCCLLFLHSGSSEPHTMENEGFEHVHMLIISESSYFCHCALYGLLALPSLLHSFLTTRENYNSELDTTKVVSSAASPRHVLCSLGKRH